MHVTKYTRGTLGHMLGHYDRTKDGLGENVVPERTQLNYNLAVDDQPLKQLDFVHKRLGEVRCLKRKDVNVLCDWVVTMPKDLADEYREPFFKAAYNFFAEKYGHDNVVSAYVHMTRCSRICISHSFRLSLIGSVTGGNYQQKKR